MPTGVVTSAKTKLYVNATPHLAATDTAAEYAALTWTEIGDIVSFGEFGASFEEIVHQPINDGETYRFKGTRNNGSLALNLGRAPADAGQAILFAAAETYVDYDFRITLNDTPAGGGTPTTMYFNGKVMSYTTSVPSSNSIVGSTANIGISGKIIEVAAAGP
jgi:hypothetical protein